MNKIKKLWLKYLLEVLVVVALAACMPNVQTTQSALPGTTPAPQPTAIPQGIGVLRITPRVDLDPNLLGDQSGISVNFSLSVSDPKRIQFQYFEISNAGKSIFVLNGYETPVGGVSVENFTSPQVIFTKKAIVYVCPPLDVANPFVVDCRGVLDILLSN